MRPPSRRARLRIVVSAAAAIAVSLVIWLPDGDATIQLGNVVLRRVGETSHGVITRIITQRRVIALTIDDGPDPRFTPAVLATLRAHHAHATFFVVGASAVRYARLIRAEVRGGDEVANHTLDHAHLQRLGPWATRREVDLGRADLIAAGAPDPLLVRAPYGEFTANLATAAARHGELLAGWSLTVERALDGRSIPAAVTWLMHRVRPGTIILAHDGLLDRTRTIATLPRLLDQLDRSGYTVLTVSELLSRDGNPAARRLLARAAGHRSASTGT